MMSFSFWRLKQDSTLGLRASVIRGSEAPPELHSLPLLLLVLFFHLFTKNIKHQSQGLMLYIWRLKQDSNL